MLEQWDTAEGYGVLSEKANVRFQGPKQGSDMLSGGVDLELRAKKKFDLGQGRERKEMVSWPG